jgi:hypothetical protein
MQAKGGDKYSVEALRKKYHQMLAKDPSFETAAGPSITITKASASKGKGKAKVESVVEG